MPLSELVQVGDDAWDGAIHHKDLLPVVYVMGDESAQVEVELSKEDFIQQLLPQAKTLQEGYGVLPSIIIGQAILESNWGASQLSSQYNNLLAILIL